MKLTLGTVLVLLSSCSLSVKAGRSHSAPRNLQQISRSAFRENFNEPRSAHAAPREHARSFNIEQLKHQQDASLRAAFAEKRGDDCTPPSYDNFVPLEPFAPFDPVMADLYRYRQQQSVNLGSLFLHEAWMTPSLFTCAAWPKGSEIDIVQGWGNVDNARQVLEKHWDTFITEGDISYLASLGINTVRLPIGYWSLGPEFCKGTSFAPYAAAYKNSWPRVVRLINFAAKYNIGVLVDLHGAPGSQNGQDIAGTSNGKMNLFYDDWNIKKAVKVLTFLTAQLANVTNVVGIQVLNEPKGVKSLEQFYNTAINAMRAVSSYASNFPIYIHDAFDLDRFVPFVRNRSDFVVIDHHAYYVYTKEDAATSVTDHTKDIKSQVSAKLYQASQDVRRNLVVDEWSSAVTPTSLNQESNGKGAQKAYGLTQESVYRTTTAGWAFWSYNLENCEVGWCFKAAVGKTLPSIFPSYADIDIVQISDSLRSKLQSIALPDISTILGNAKQAKKMSSKQGKRDETPQGWFSVFEDYPDFQERYEVFQCDNQHGSEFWSECCRPLLKTEKVVDLPEICQIESRNHRRDSIDNSNEIVSWAGFQDGFNITIALGSFGLSKLGFTGQYGMEQLKLRQNKEGKFSNETFEFTQQQGLVDSYWKYYYQGISYAENSILTTIQQNS